MTEAGTEVTEDVLSGELAGPIKAAAISVEKARSNVEGAKSDLKAAKGVPEMEEKNLRGLLHDASTGQRRLPLKDGEAAPVVGSLDAWRSLSVADLGLSKALTDHLTDAGINTLGELSAYTAPNATGYCKAYDDIEGIGLAGGEKITEAFDLFWSDRPEYCQSEEPAEPEADEGEPAEEPEEAPAEE